MISGAAKGEKKDEDQEEVNREGIYTSVSGRQRPQASITTTAAKPSATGAGLTLLNSRHIYVLNVAQLVSNVTPAEHQVIADSTQNGFTTSLDFDDITENFTSCKVRRERL